MTRLKAIFLTVTLLILLQEPAAARSGGDLPPVFDIVAGGHAAFLGGAYTAVSGNSSAVFYNPGGLFQVDGTEFSLHYEGVAGFFSQSGFAGFSRQLGSIVTLGLGLKFIVSGDQFNSDQLSSGQFDSFGESQYLFGAAVGFNFPFIIKPGITLKFGLRSLQWDDETAARNLRGAFFNFDLGFMLPVNRFLQFGLRLENVLPDVSFGIDGGNEPVPTRAMAGALVRLFDNKVTFAFDAGFLTGIKEFEYHLGIAYRPLKVLDLSFGLDDNRLVFGTALYISDFQFYFSVLLLDQLAPSTRLSINYSIGKKKEHYKKVETELKLLTDGMNEFSTGKYSSALRRFKKVLDLNPLNSTARRMVRIAETRLQKSDWATDQQKARIKKFYDRGMTLFNSGEYADARKAFVHALDIDPLHWDSRDKVAEIDRKLQDLRDTAFKQAVKQFIRNDLDGAGKTLRKLLDADPEHRQGLELLRRINLLEKDIREQHRKEQIRLQNARIYYQRGLELMKRKIYVQAAKSFKLASSFSDDKQINYQYNLARKKVEDLKIDRLSSVKSQQFLKLGLRQSTNMQLTKAIKSFEKSLNYDPHNKQAEQKLLQLLQQRNKMVKQPFDEGVSLYKQGKYLEALQKWRTALRIDEEYKPAKQYIQTTRKEMVKRAEYNVKLAESYLRQGGDGNTFDALKYYQRALMLDGKNVAAKQGLRQARRQVEDKAKKYFDEGFAALKSNSLSRLNDAIDNFEKYLLIKSDDEQARQFLQQAKKKRREQRDYFIVERLKKEGIDFYNNRDYQKAVDKFKEVLKYDKNNRAITAYLSKAEQRLKLIAGRNEVMKIFNDGIRHFKIREYSQAIDTWKKILNLALATEDDKKMVAGYIDTANEVRKYNQNKFFLQGKAFADQDKLLEARDALDEALKINQYHTQARNLLADVKDRIRTKALSLLQQAQQQFAAGRYSRSLELLRMAYKFRSDDDRINNLLDEAGKAGELAKKADELYRNGKYTEAIVLYEQMKQYNSNDPLVNNRIEQLSRRLSTQTAVFLQRAQSMLQQNRYKEALLSLQLVLRIVKYSPDKRNARISSEYALKLQKEAVTKMNDALLNNYTAGLNAYNRGDLNGALVFFNRVYALDYKYKQVRNYRRTVLTRLAAVRQAAAQKQQGIIQQLLYTGINLYRNGRYQQAINTWNRILAISPNHSAARSYIARARFKLGQ